MSATSPNRFREVVLLGRGGMGEVYLAVTFGIGGFRKLLVLKRLRPEFAENQEFLRMFLDEAKLAARLEHPNIVRTIEVGVDDWSYFIAMEYLEGQSLHSVLRESRKRGFAAPSSDRGSAAAGIGLTFLQRVYLKAIADTCAGLHYAHEKVDHAGQPLRIVHRDISPGNVFVTYEGVVKVLDFGIAKAADSNTHTQVGVLKGKVPYMAPESLVSRGQKPDRRADVYAVGAMLWDCATGERLWKGLPDLEIMSRVARGNIPSPRLQAPDLPPELERIVLRALDPDVSRRYATALEVQNDVEELLHGAGTVSSRALGKYVMQLFEARRAEAKTVIDQRLREIQHDVASSSGPHGVLSMSFASAPISSSPESPLRPGDRPGLPSSALAPSVASIPVGHHSVPPTAVSAHRSGQSPGAPPPQVTSHRPPPPTTGVDIVRPDDLDGGTSPSRLTAGLRNPWPLRVGLGVAALAAAGAVAAVVLTTPEGPAELPGAEAGGDGSVGSASEDGASVATPGPQVAQLRMSATPATATFALDGVALVGNPVTMRVPSDDKSHVVEVKAPGHQTVTQRVTFDGEQQLQFVLKKTR